VLIDGGSRVNIITTNLSVDYYNSLVHGLFLLKLKTIL
jgi:hypothetical protein